MDTVKHIQEGSASITASVPDKVSKKMDVFYNPAMKHNRDMIIALLRASSKKDLRISLPLAGTGVRAIRLVKELNGGQVKEIFANDIKEEAVALIKQNLKDNKIDPALCTVSCDEGALFLAKNRGFDYIDIDPFGSPNNFLDQAVCGLAREGILAVTATDTATLCGRYRKTCKRYYDATPHRGYLQHEIGLRILIKKIQTVAMQYDKALIPLFCYKKDHYFRAILYCDKSKARCDDVLKEHDFLSYDETTGIYTRDSKGKIGPLWFGSLGDITLVRAMRKELPDDTFLATYEKELAFPPFYYDLHALSKIYKCDVARTELTPSHFHKYCVKSDLSPKEFIDMYIKKERRIS